MISRLRRNSLIIQKGIRGFTLIEVMVAMTILLLVILPLASLYVKSLTVIQNAALYSQSIQLAQERMEVCLATGYGALDYYNELFTPGFPYEGPLPPAYLRDGSGANMVPVSNAYDNRDNPDTTDLEWYFDPTDSNAENYPVPVYRDYYNNYTGQCLDPNFNGLCDDDLDGDGGAGIMANPIDMDDIEIATNGRLLQYSDNLFQGTKVFTDLKLSGTYAPGDGLSDTVCEGSYVSSMDPMYRMIRRQESASPILDYSLLLDNAHRAAVADYRHRETPFKNFVRMTTFIDPTPSLGNPRFVDTWVDQLYIHDRIANDSYTALDVQKLVLCLNRDLPYSGGYGNMEVGVDTGGQVNLDPFNVNYASPTYGMRVIVTVFYLTGEGEMQAVDTNGDGVIDEERPSETYGGARRVRLERFFYNTFDITGSQKQYAPPRKFDPAPAGNADNPVKALTIPDVSGTGADSDACSLDNKGLPYMQ